MESNNPRLSNHIRQISLPPLRPIFMKTFDFSKLKSLEMSAPHKKKKINETDIFSALPVSIINKVSILTVKGNNKFTPSFAAPGAVSVPGTLRTPLYYPPDVETMRNSQFASPYMKKTVKKTEKRALQATRARFFSKPRKIYELSMQINDNDLAITSSL
jgi:hypothetical protein